MLNSIVVRVTARRSGDFRPARMVPLGILVCLLITFLFFAAACSGTGEAAQGEAAETPAAQPNIVFIPTDDLDSASAQ